MSGFPLPHYKLASVTGKRHLRLWVGVIDGSGSFIKGPEEITSAGIGWGNRDDSLRTRPDGHVSWVSGNASSATLNFYIFDGSDLTP